MQTRTDEKMKALNFEIQYLCHEHGTEHLVMSHVQVTDEIEGYKEGDFVTCTKCNKSIEKKNDQTNAA